MKLYQRLAHAIQRRINCKPEFVGGCEEDIRKYIVQLPRGSGIDGETTVDYSKSNGELIWLRSSYHYRNEMERYDGWIHFSVVVMPSLVFGINLCVKGRFHKHQDIKDYLEEIFIDAFTREAA